MIEEAWAKEQQDRLIRIFEAKNGSSAIRSELAPTNVTVYVGPSRDGKVDPARTSDIERLFEDFEQWLEQVDLVGHEFKNVNISFRTGAPTTMMDEIDRIRNGDLHIWHLVEWDE